MLRLLLVLSIAVFGVGLYGVIGVGPSDDGQIEPAEPIMTAARPSIRPARSSETSETSQAEPEVLVARPKVRVARTQPDRLVPDITRNITGDSSLPGIDVFVNATSVNMRAEPSLSGTNIGVLTYGSKLRHTGIRSGAWLEIDLGREGTGWMHRDYLAFEPISQ